jgi:hypothetical protein
MVSFTGLLGARCNAGIVTALRRRVNLLGVLLLQMKKLQPPLPLRGGGVLGETACVHGLLPDFAVLFVAFLQAQAYFAALLGLGCGGGALGRLAGRGCVAAPRGVGKAGVLGALAGGGHAFS